MKKVLLLAIAVSIAFDGTGQSKRNLLKSSQTIEYRLDSVVYVMWNQFDNTWLTNNKDKYTYDDNGYLHWITNYHRDNPESNWIASFNKEAFYDKAGRLSSQIRSNWDVSSDQWIPAVKDEHFYDENGNDTLFQSYNWNAYTGEWIMGVKYVKAFNNKGNQTSELVMFWDAENIHWDSVMRRKFFYDENGQDTMFYAYFWETIEGMWNLSNKVRIYHDENGKDTLILNYNNTASITNTTHWLLSCRQIYKLDENGRVIQERSYLWDEALQVWTGGYRKEYTYDEHGNATIIEQYGWDTGTSQWIIMTNLYQYFSEYGISKVPDNTIPGYTVYPNPAHDFIYFDVSDVSKSSGVEIYNVQGKKVLEQNLSGSNQISVRNLSKGLYIYKLNMGQISKTGKLVIE